MSFSDHGTTLIVIGGILFLMALLVCWGQPRVQNYMMRWQGHIPDLEESPDLFYARVFQLLKERLAKKGLPPAILGFGPGRLFGNRTLWGPRPLYLIVHYSHLKIYVFASPSPTGLYVSYWCYSKYLHWEGIPLLNLLLQWRTYQMTLFQFDSAEIFLQAIEQTVHDVIDGYCEERGLKPLEAYERRPVWNAFYARHKQSFPTAAEPMMGRAVLPMSNGGPKPVASVPAAPVPTTGATVQVAE